MTGCDPDESEEPVEKPTVKLQEIAPDHRCGNSRRHTRHDQQHEKNGAKANLPIEQRREPDPGHEHRWNDQHGVIDRIAKALPEDVVMDDAFVVAEIRPSANR